MNYVEIKESIEAYLQGDEDSFVARMDEFVWQTEQEIYRSVRPPVCWDTDDGNVILVPGTATFTLPTNTLEVFDISLKEAGVGGNETKPLRLVDESYIREAYPISTATGEPYHYALLDDTTGLLGPTPDASYPLIVHRFRFPESIVTAGQNWLGTNCEKALIFGALANGYLFLKGETDLQQSYQAQYERQLQIMNPEASHRPTSPEEGTAE